MKKLLFPVIALMMLSCNTAQPIGMKKDANGCNSAAGQSWSKIKNTCIRVFDEGTRLNPVTQTSSAVISAFVLNSPAEDEVEIFLPDNKGSKILKKVEAGVFTDGVYKYMSQGETLSKNGVVMYKAKSE